LLRVAPPARDAGANNSNRRKTMYQQTVLATDEGLLDDRDLDSVTGGGLKEKAIVVGLGILANAAWEGIKWVGRKLSK
jgi:hypothetical protein